MRFFSGQQQLSKHTMAKLHTYPTHSLAVHWMATTIDARLTPPGPKQDALFAEADGALEETFDAALAAGIPFERVNLLLGRLNEKVSAKVKSVVESN